MKVLLLLLFVTSMVSPTYAQDNSGGFVGFVFRLMFKAIFEGGKKNNSPRGIITVTNNNPLPQASVVTSGDTSVLTKYDVSPDINEIVKWISQEYTKDNVEYCNREVKGRGFGIIPSVCSGDSIGLLCYSKCDTNFERLNFLDPRCGAKCPPGYAGTSVWTCYRGPILPESESAIRLDSCRSGYNDIGLICTKGIFDWYWKGSSVRCREGWTLVLGVCYRGGQFADSKYREIRDTTILGKTCRDDEEYIVGLCYKKAPGYSCPTPNICYKSCPLSLSECGLGCSTDSDDCTTTILNMVVSTVFLPINLLTLGATSKLSVMTKIPKIANFVDKNKDIINIANAGQIGGQAMEELVGLINDMVAQNSNDMTAITSPRIERELGLKYERNSDKYRQIVRSWSTSLLSIIFKDSSLKLALLATEVIDPTGIASVVNAFNNPDCQDIQTLDAYLNSGK